MRRIATTLMATCLLFFVACSDEGDVVTIYKCIPPFHYMKVLPVSRKW